MTAYLKNINLLPDDKMPVPAWAQVKLLGYYTLLKIHALKVQAICPK
jgi:endoglucanase